MNDGRDVMVHAVCAVNGCFSSSRLECCQHLSWHRIPGDKRKDSWLRAIGRPDLAEKSKLQLTNSYVCSLHFEPWLFKKGQKKKKLPFAALPTLNPVPTLTFEGFKEHDVASVDEVGKMPRKYVRKEGVVPRCIEWTENDLMLAFEDIEKGDKGINEIARSRGIPCRTLRRRFMKRSTEKGTLGKHPLLGLENEARLVNHILKLGEAGSPPNRQSIRLLAYNFAESLGLNHNFDRETEMAGNAWFNSFMERHPVLSIRQAEGLSMARAKGLNREEITDFFALLTKTLTENNLLDKPERIFNMDESGVHLNNKPGKVVAKKGVRTVKQVTFGEKGETITVVGCCNAIGNFIPPVLILKGVNKKPEFEHGLPPGSKVYMSKKSAYINTDLFYTWLTEHFIPHKPQGKVLLIYDGHSSHSSAVDMIEAARENDVILLCLPSHTTSALQPLDRAVFGPFKTYYHAETNHLMRTNPTKKLSRYNSGKLIANAWGRATTPANAISGFRGSGIYPINPNAVPDSEFAISDIALSNLKPAGSEMERRQPSADIMVGNQEPAEVEQQQPADVVMGDQEPAEAEQQEPADVNSSTNESSVDADQSKEEKEEPDDVLPPEEPEIKQEIEDSISEHEEDIIEKLNRKRELETDPLETGPLDSDPVTDLIKRVKKRTNTSKSLLRSTKSILTFPRIKPKMPEQSTSTMLRPIEENGSLPVDFMKSIMNSQNEILTVLKSQVLLQNPDPDLLPFLRFVGAKLSYLDQSKRKEIQNAIIDFLNNS